MLRKFLKIMIINLVVLSNVFSCTRKTYELQLITDAGTITDKSFNEQSYRAIKMIANKYHQNYTFQRPDAVSEQAFLNAYNAARLSGAKVMVASGPWHLGLKTLEKFIKLKPEIKYITIDFDFQKTKLDWNKIQVAQLNYRAEESGFFAGIGAALFLNLVNKIKNKELKVSTFGGVMLPNVINFMAGYKIAIEWWNKNKELALKLVKEIDKTFETKQFKMIKFIAGSKAEQFSGSFKVNEPNVKNILDRLIGIEKVDVIMPVAGPQTLNVINYIKEKEAATKIIGVDVDQAKIFNFAEDLFLTSALKNIEISLNSTLESVYHGEKEAAKIFKKFPMYGGIKEGWTGIAVSKYLTEKMIEQIYTFFKTKNNDWFLLEQELNNKWEQLTLKYKINDLWAEIVKL